MVARNTDTPNSKLIKKLNKLKGKVDKKIWEEICQTIKVISQEGYKLPDQEDYSEMAERICKKAQMAVAKRRKYASYGKIKGGELLRAWCIDPQLRTELDSKFQWFVSLIRDTFPDSPIHFITEYGYLRDMSDEEIDRMIRDLPQKQTNGKAGDETKTPAEAERNAPINIQNFQGILGNVQAENVQTGNDSFVDKHVEIKKEKKSIIKIILGTIGAIIIAIIAAAVVDILGHFGLFEKIYSIFAPR
jgi:hypothetical protein